MTTHWYATEMLVEDRKHEIERSARLAVDRHVTRGNLRTRRWGRRR